MAEAEEIAGHDPAQIQWKTSSARMNELFESWKTAQKSGVRLGRSNEDALWKRFRAARTVFDRHRRAYFSQLDSNNSAAKAAKEKLIAEAEALSTSTDWGFAAGEYRRLMDDWKASPRASRKDDDALWARFRAAQDVFFTNRQAANDEIDQEYGANLVVKEALLAEANELLPDQGPRRRQEGPPVHPRPLGRSRQGSRAPTWDGRSRAAEGGGRRPRRRRRELEALQPGDEGPHQQRPDPAGSRHRRPQGRPGQGREGRRRAQDQGSPGSSRGPPGLAGAARAFGERTLLAAHKEQDIEQPVRPRSGYPHDRDGACSVSGDAARWLNGPLPARPLPAPGSARRLFELPPARAAGRRRTRCTCELYSPGALFSWPELQAMASDGVLTQLYQRGYLPPGAPLTPQLRARAAALRRCAGHPAAGGGGADDGGLDLRLRRASPTAWHCSWTPTGVFPASGPCAAARSMRFGWGPSTSSAWEG